MNVFVKLNSQLFFPLFAFSFFTLLLFFHGRFEGYEKETFFAAHDIVFGGDISPRTAVFGVLLSAPFAIFYEAAHLFGWETLRDFMGPLSVVFYTALIPCVFYYLNELLFSSRVALIQSIFLLLGTMIFPYANIGMEHTVTLALLISFTFLVSNHFKSDGRFVIFSAAALSAAVLIKSYSILFALPAVLYFLTARTFKKNLRAHLISFCILAAAVIAHFSWNYAIFGNLFSGQYRLAWEFQYESLISGMYGFLLSPGKGIFFFNPVLLLAIPGFFQFFKKEKALFALTLGTIFVFALFQSPFKFWSDEIWGPRKLLMIIPLLFLPAGYVWLEFKKVHLPAKIAVFFIVTASFFAQILGTLYRTGKYLFFLREFKLDALPFMQYVPALSQINVHWFFLKAYLYHLIARDIPVFSYKIESWMRDLFPAVRNVVLVGGKTAPKEIFYTPDMWYLSKQMPYVLVSAEYKLLYIMVVILGIFISGKILYDRIK